MPLGEALHQSLAVLMSAPDQVIGDPGVKRTVLAVVDEVNVVAALHHDSQA